ncbi:MAG TPA: hypothetical protein VGH88_24620 [Streptosporangiaceae bacterium]
MVIVNDRARIRVKLEFGAVVSKGRLEIELIRIQARLPGDIKPFRENGRIVVGIVEFAPEQDAGIGEPPLKLRGLVLQVSHAPAPLADAIIGLRSHPSPLACGL